MKSEGKKDIILKCGPWRKTSEEEEEEEKTQKQQERCRDSHRTRKRRTVECVRVMSSLFIGVW